MKKTVFFIAFATMLVATACSVNESTTNEEMDSTAVDTTSIVVDTTSVLVDSVAAE